MGSCRGIMIKDVRALLVVTAVLEVKIETCALPCI